MKEMMWSDGMAHMGVCDICGRISTMRPVIHEGRLLQMEWECMARLRGDFDDF